jgi:hypothetical protein
MCPALQVHSPISNCTKAEVQEAKILQVHYVPIHYGIIIIITIIIIMVGLL